MTQTARERLFARSEGRTKDVTLSGGDVVQVKALTLSARTQLVKACTEGESVDMEKLVPHLIIASVVVEGEPMFSAGDLETLQQLPAIEIDPLWEAAAALNGFAKEEKTAAKNG